MATWTDREITYIQEYLKSKDGPITSNDHNILKQTLTTSVAAIKKKCLELKHNLNQIPTKKKQTNGQKTKKDGYYVNI